MPVNEYGIYIRGIRKKINIKLEDMAIKLNVSKSFLSALENAIKTIPQDFADKAALALGLSSYEKNELKNSIDISNEKIILELSSMTKEQRELALAFARKISSLNENEISELLNSLKNKG